MLVGAHAEVLDGLTSVPLAAEQDGVRTSGGAERQLVEGQDLTASLQNALLGRLGEAEGGNSELGHLQKADIIGHSADSDDDLGVTVGCVRSLLDNPGEGNGRTVDLGEEQAVEDRLNDRKKLSSPVSESPNQTNMTLLNAESVRLARKR